MQNEKLKELIQWLEVNIENLKRQKANNLYMEGVKKGMITNADLILGKTYDLQQKVEQQENEIDRLNNIINELEKYIHNELLLDFYNDDMPCELIINKMEKMIKELKEELRI